MTEITPTSSSLVDDAQTARPSVLHVCTSCRTPGSPREPEENRAGFKLYQELSTVFRDSTLGHHVKVQPTVCLNVCSRSLPLVPGVISSETKTQVRVQVIS